jgi:hypothetical protein
MVSKVAWHPLLYGINHQTSGWRQLLHFINNGMSSTSTVHGRNHCTGQQWQGFKECTGPTVLGIHRCTTETTAWHQLVHGIKYLMVWTASLQQYLHGKNLCLAAVAHDINVSATKINSDPEVGPLADHASLVQ